MVVSCRDWLRTLWPASYKGFPFFFDKDEEEGGLGIVIHKFPGRDDPFNEDMGEEPRFFSGTAYIHGDDVDAQDGAFKAVLVSHGPGVLVIPVGGPKTVRCVTFKRTHEKDKLGYLAYDVKFVREGTATALISVPFAGQQAFAAADGVAAALVARFPATVATVAQPQYVADAAVDAVVSQAMLLDGARLSSPVDPAVSAQVRDALVAIEAAAPLLLGREAADPDAIANLAAAIPPSFPGAALIANAGDGATAIAAALTAVTRALGDGMAPAAAQPVMADLAAASVVVLAPAYLSPGLQLSAENEAAIARAARLAALTAWAEALIGRTYASRPEGVTARAEAAERFGVELEECVGGDEMPLYIAIETLQAATVAYLTKLIADLAPVVSVSAPAIMPCLWWSWRLYQDPTRAVDLVLRNGVRHPSFMPRAFAALAPGFAPQGLQTQWPAPPL